MRVSERQRYWVANHRINKGRSDNLSTLNTLSSQKQINQVHDDPICLTRALKLKDRIAEIADYKKNVDFSKGYLDVTESAISGIYQLLGRAQELALAMANDSYDGANRAITAKEVKEVVTEVIQMANSKYGNRYIFSGFRSLSPAIDLEGNYLGDDGQIFLQIGPEHFKRVNISGRDLFGVGADERQHGHFAMIDVLNLLDHGLENNDKDAIYKVVNELTYQMDKVASYQASVGAVWNAVDQAEKKLDFDELQKIEFLSKIEDVDVYKASSDFKRTESVLQSTLLASNKLLQPSLLNFLQ